MPNIQKSDYVAQHTHGPEEIVGIGHAIAPPTEVAVGTTVSPTVLDGTFIELDEMSIAVALPTTYPRYQLTARFTGMFDHDAAAGIVSIKLQQDGVDIGSTTRQESGSAPNIAFSMAVQATVEAAGGTTPTLRVMWANPTAAGSIATAIGVQRRFEIDYKPLTGVPS